MPDTARDIVFQALDAIIAKHSVQYVAKRDRQDLSDFIDKLMDAVDEHLAP